MIPVYQTAYGYGKGNCLAACVASITEIPFELVDSIGLQRCCDGNEQLELLSNFLLKHGYSFIQIKTNTTNTEQPFFFQGAGYYIVSGYIMLNDEPVFHSMVACNQEIVHNPHRGIKNEFESCIEEFIIIYKMNPSVNIEHYIDDDKHQTMINNLNRYFNAINGREKNFNYQVVTNKEQLDICLKQLIVELNKIIPGNTPESIMASFETIKYFMNLLVDCDCDDGEILNYFIESGFNEEDANKIIAMINALP